MSQKLAQATMPEVPDLISVREATQLSGLSRATLYRLLRSGRLTRYESKLGAGRGGPRVRLDRAELKRLMRPVKATWKG